MLVNPIQFFADPGVNACLVESGTTFATAYYAKQIGLKQKSALKGLTLIIYTEMHLRRGRLKKLHLKVSQGGAQGSPMNFSK